MTDQLFPGIYVEEAASGVRAITGAATSTTGFVGVTERGPVAEAFRVRSYGEFEREFGRSPEGAYLGSSVRLFFANGGKDAWVVRWNGGSKDVPMRAFDPVEALGLLCLPGETDPEVLHQALTYCVSRRTFLLVDLPRGWDAAHEPPLLDTTNLCQAAAYYPWLIAEGDERPCPPSGALAGVIARTDVTRGVWAAPAGVEASMVGVVGPTRSLSQVEAGVLTEAGINPIRVLGSRVVVWGARTLDVTSEWKYVPLRRLALFIEHSLAAGIQWSVFEPNDEPLWAGIRGSVQEFLEDLFRRGAFTGSTPQDAFFVRCGRDTTTQEDIDRGLVNVVVGVAPLRPAEFVIIRIQQMAGRWRKEALGRGTGLKDQRFRLSETSVGPVRVFVDEGQQGRWVEWEQVQRFDASGPDDRHFLLGRTAGEVSFGDGEHGQMPARGEGIRASYRVGGGGAGRLAPIGCDGSAGEGGIFLGARDIDH